MLAIVAGRPRVLSLLEVIEHFIEFRREVVRRRIEFELRKAEARAHILDGLRIALDHIDAVIALIRASKTTPEAKVGLVTHLRAVGNPGPGHPRPAAAAPDRPGAAEDPRRAGRADPADREAAHHPRQPAAAAADHRRRTEGGAGQVQRSAPHRHHRGRERVQHRGSDRRRGRGDHRHRHRLHQADADLDLPQPAARRQGTDRDADPRRGRGQPPLRRLDALLHDDLHRPRPGLLAQGPRDPRRRRRRPRQVDRQPGADGGRREDRGDGRGARVRRRPPRGDGHAARARSRRPSCRRSPIRGPAASSPWASTTATR